MKLKYFEDSVIPEEINIFYDDLAEKYLKSTYDFGKEEKGDIIQARFGRYLLSKSDIEKIENVDFNYLIYTNEGHEKQDELVLKYHRDVLINEIKDLIEEFADIDFDVSNIEYFDGIKNIDRENLKEYETNKIRASMEGLLIAAHIFGRRKILKVFVKEYIYVKDNIPITYYMQLKNYDLSYLLEDFYEKKVIPNETKENLEKIEINDVEQFVGQNEKGLKEQIKEVLMENKESFIKSFLETLNKKDKKNVQNKIDDKKPKENVKNKEIVDFQKEKEQINKKIDENYDKIIKFLKENNKNDSYIVKSNKRVEDKLQEKFENEYANEDEDYTRYFEDTTNTKVSDEDKKVFNEVLKSKESTEPKSVVNQKNFSNYRNIKKDKMNILDYVYDICINSLNPLEELENCLCFLTCKYQNESKIDYLKNLSKRVAKKKIKNYIFDKISDLSKIEIPKLLENYYLKYGIADIDDFKFNIARKKLSVYPNTKEYRLLKLFIDRNLVKQSYSKYLDGKRVYKRARRFLDNLLIALYASMQGLNNEDFDGVKNKDENILRLYLIYLDEYLEGLDYILLKELCSIKPVGITSTIAYLLKSKNDYVSKSFEHISFLMHGKKYEKYSKNTSDISLLKKYFKTKESLKYNMKLRNSYDIYLFYESLYSDDKENIKSYFVCDGAKISCTNGDITRLIVEKSDKFIEGKKCANIKNKKIINFKFCKVNKVCSPTLQDWQEKTKVLVSNEKALLSTAKTFCTFGGILKIEDPNQKVSSITEEENEIDYYEINDYKPLEDIIEFTENLYFKNFIFKTYYKNKSFSGISKSYQNQIKKILKPSFDLKKLVKEEVIPAVDVKNKTIVNAYFLANILQGYFFPLNSNERYEKIGSKFKEEKNFANILEKSREYLPVLFSPYNLNARYLKKPVWMQKVFSEFSKKYNKRQLMSAVRRYHLYGANLNAGIETPWCASFANYVLNTGLKSASSQCFYSKEGKKYFDKIPYAKYGSILVIDNGNGTGHCTFVLKEDKKGYLCLGGNQSNMIKKSYYKKDKKIKGFYWPK